MVTDIKELKCSVDIFEKNGITDVTISGGEPTLHPNLSELVSYIQNKNISVTLLSNSEKFSDLIYLKQFIKSVSPNSLKIITTLHSSSASEHEDANQTPKSFYRSILGLQNLFKYGFRIIIKHCITKKNYKDLVNFYKYCDDAFEKSVDIQLCSIDYCGIPLNRLQDERLTFQTIKPELEKLFDYHFEQKKYGTVRKLYCINMPLCSCDPYYWEYLPRKRKRMYNSYKDPHGREKMDFLDNVGIYEKYCRDCNVASLCVGTYFSAYSAVGPEIVNPFI